MAKRFGLVLAALLVVSSLLAACGTETRDTGKDYMKAVLDGNGEKAEGLACDDFKDTTRALAEAYAALDINDVDLKYDIGKGSNEKEVIVTGSYKIGKGNDADEIELASTVRIVDEESGEETEERDTRIVLWLDKDGDDWCVSAETELGDELNALVNPAAVDEDEAGDAAADDAAESEEAAGDESE
ncbi:MAG: hypothetical protein JW966_11105 [Anaerolineae bacterium]|nr:hypothetical protein [Anaerolineae bacterium]